MRRTGALYVALSSLFVCASCFKSPISIRSPSKLTFSSHNRRHDASLRMTSDASDSGNSNKIARITFVAGSSGSSGFGETSPEPNPTWSTVSAQLARRIQNFAGTTSSSSSNNDDGDIQSDLIQASSIEATSLNPNSLKNADIVVALGVSDPEEERMLKSALDETGASLKALLTDPTCGDTIRNRRFGGSYTVYSENVERGIQSSSFQDTVADLAPWTSVASGKRLLGKVDTLLSRQSSEDYIFAVLFAVHSLVVPIDVVKSDINPSWEKGPIRNAQEFQKMCDKCGPQIFAALSDPQTKKAIDLLNAVDLRDQVGSYRVIVSNETPELEDFTLCILQQNDCFGCDAPILDRPKVPILQQWRGKALDHEASRQIMIGHLDHPAAQQECSQLLPWSWKIVVGANPAYDAFPMQHQIFYPSGKTGSSSLWYDPVFCVETLDDDRVWCKRHYRCTPRKHWSSEEDVKGSTPGAWMLSTLDNGMVSEERWTTVDAADDLSWAVLHYSGAARRAGQSYVGALLCTPDGQWPESCRSGEGLERIRDAFQKCDLELWELFGGSTDKSYMWSDKFTSWAEMNPPPLDRIGDISITSWRKKEREKALEAKRS